MESELTDRMLPTIIRQLETKIRVQSDMNNCYDDLVNFVIEEAKESINTKDNKRSGRKEHTVYKEYWDETLSKLWKDMKECERIYRTVKRG